MAIKITGEWKGPCPDCGAPGSCCEASKSRLGTADSLARLVERQSAKITDLSRQLGEARQVASDLRAKAAV